MNTKKKRASLTKYMTKSLSGNLKFSGYVLQQYKAKTVRGEKVHVKAYEKISKQIPKMIERQICSIVEDAIHIEDFFLGEIENLHTSVPMSQTANVPIFGLKAKDGVR
ncbi:MAG: hypothetical protein U5K56_02785 [Halioglobus sp.]|nr:hypothetical protein [Halioglobus sp.]